jgi:hypothetical protein
VIAEHDFLLVVKIRVGDVFWKREQVVPGEFQGDLFFNPLPVLVGRTIARDNNMVLAAIRRVILFLNF